MDSPGWGGERSGGETAGEEADAGEKKPVTLREKIGGNGGQVSLGEVIQGHSFIPSK